MHHVAKAFVEPTGERPDPCKTIDPVPLWRDPVASWLLVGGLGLIAAWLLYRVIGVENAVVFQDEYLYRAGSDRMIDQVLLLRRGLIPELPNWLYLRLMWLHSGFTRNGYVVAGALNVLVYLAAAVPLVRITGLLGLPPRTRALAVIVALALPFGLYTKYFMPEALYFTLFVAAQAVLMQGLVRNRLVLLGFAGALVAALTFVKPHGLLLIGTGVLAIAAQAWTTGPSGAALLRRTAAFLTGCLVPMPILRYVLKPAWVQSNLGTYNSIAGDWKGALTWSVGHEPAALLGYVAYSAWGHFLFFGLLYGLAFCAALFFVRRRIATANPAASALAVVALVNLAVLMAVSIVYSGVLAYEHGNIHFRYYAFDFCLLVLLLFVPQARPASRRERLLAGAILCAISLAAVLLGKPLFHDYSPDVVSQGMCGGPDYAVVGLPQWAFAALACMPLASATLLLRGRPAWRRVAIAFVLTFSLLDAVLVTRQIRAADRLVRGETTAAVAAVVPAGDWNDMLLVSSGRDSASKFLFWLKAAPYTLYRSSQEPPEGVFRLPYETIATPYRPQKKPVTAADLPPGIKWLVLLGDAAIELPSATKVLERSDVTVFRLHDR